MKRKNYDTGRCLTGAELRFAAANNLVVVYEERFHNPEDRHNNYYKLTTMEKAREGYYIGNSDIDPEAFSPEEEVKYAGDYSDMEVRAAVGIDYQ